MAHPAKAPLGCNEAQPPLSGPGRHIFHLPVLLSVEHCLVCWRTNILATKVPSRQRPPSSVCPRASF